MELCKESLQFIKDTDLHKLANSINKFDYNLEDKAQAIAEISKEALQRLKAFNLNIYYSSDPIEETFHKENELFNCLFIIRKQLETVQQEIANQEVSEPVDIATNHYYYGA